MLIISKGVLLSRLSREEVRSYLRHRHSLWRPAVQNDHPVDWHLLPLGVLLKVFPQVCGER